MTAKQERAKKLQKARERLQEAIAASWLTRGEAAWCQGYRTARARWAPKDVAEDERLWQKEKGWWKANDKADQKVKRAIRALIVVGGARHE